jgi:hypothetical protein
LGSFLLLDAVQYEKGEVMVKGSNNIGVEIPLRVLPNVQESFKKEG